MDFVKMNSRCITLQNDTSISSPKRRRIQSAKASRKNLAEDCSPINSKKDAKVNTVLRCDSPSLPCNQDEYMTDPSNNSLTNYNSPRSPSILGCSESTDGENWDSLLINTGDLDKSINRSLKTTCEVSSNEIFQSSTSIINRKSMKSEHSYNQKSVSSVRNWSQCENENPYTKMFISSENGTEALIKDSTDVSGSVKIKECYLESLEESFDLISESICNYEKKNKTLLFDDKSSFFPDFRESGIVATEEVETKSAPPEQTSSRTLQLTMPLNSHPISAPKLETLKQLKPPESKQSPKLKILDDVSNSFYGLPMITKGLFKTYRNIEKFYDWQEECLNLNAVRDRHNLIYALPTSGGKTLVAEVLMLREIVNRKRNALFILPFVAIVQEKIWSLSPFAVTLDFLVEEYAAGKGHIPPKKRRRKNSIYIATIEKGLALVRSLIELKRLDELGLIVVDELHLIGEKGRGGTLETLLSLVKFTNKNIQIVGMSATIGNIPEIAQWLGAEVFEREFRPVELKEYVKIGPSVYRICWRGPEPQLELDRTPDYKYSVAAVAADPDALGGLVAERAPRASVLVFCPTQRNCQSVARLLADMARREMAEYQTKERALLAKALREEGATNEMIHAVKYGVAYHHAGLTSDQRSLLESAFRAGAVSVLCCTSTLAAGVNLPARRVIVRAPRQGREPLSLAAYRQMCGRAGRAGVCDTGESIIICNEKEWAVVRGVLAGGLARARSALAEALPELALGAAALGLAGSARALRGLLDSTLMAAQMTDEHREADIKSMCDKSIESLIQSGVLEVVGAGGGGGGGAGGEGGGGGGGAPLDDTELAVSRLGRAAIKGCMNISTAKQLQQDLETASRSLVLIGSLHLLYLVTPHDGAGIKLDYRHYYSLYCDLDEEGTLTAKTLGINEMNAIRMMTGKPITNVSANVLSRFYLAMMLNDVWKQMPIRDVSDKYGVSMGALQGAAGAGAARAAAAGKFCEALGPRWPFAALLAALALRLQHIAAPQLHHLMELPAVKKARAVQLSRAGYKRIEDIGRASPTQLAEAVPHLSITTATQLISAARMMLIEKVENLRAEAEEVMEELNF